MNRKRNYGAGQCCEFSLNGGESSDTYNSNYLTLRKS